MAAALSGCGPDSLSENEKKAVASLAIWAMPPLPRDASNRVADDPEAAALGAAFFADPAFSANGEFSCQSCHRSDRQFQDDLPRAVAIGMTDRRTMPLAGVAHSPFLFWDGRRDSLWAQALTPMENAVEQGGNRAAFAHTIAEHYRDSYEAVFGPLPDFSGVPANASPLGTQEQKAAWEAMTEGRRDAVNRVFSNVGKSIAAFERMLSHPETRFDRFASALASGKEPEGDAAFSDLEIEGLKLFVGPANCTECHNGPRFTDGHFHNTGVPQAEGVPDDHGRAAAISELLADPFNCLGAYSDAKPDDCRELRFMVTEGPALERAFKTPSLRGVASRAPYMHSGQFATLAEVIDHYRTAPEAPSGETELPGFSLTERGRLALIAFLKTLD